MCDENLRSREGFLWVCSYDDSLSEFPNADWLRLSSNLTSGRWLAEAYFTWLADISFLFFHPHNVINTICTPYRIAKVRNCENFVSNRKWKSFKIQRNFVPTQLRKCKKNGEAYVRIEKIRKTRAKNGISYFGEAFKIMGVPIMGLISFNFWVLSLVGIKLTNFKL